MSSRCCAAAAGGGGAAVRIVVGVRVTVISLTVVVEVGVDVDGVIADMVCIVVFWAIWFFIAERGEEQGEWSTDDEFCVLRWVSSSARSSCFSICLVSYLRKAVAVEGRYGPVGQLKFPSFCTCLLLLRISKQELCVGYAGPCVIATVYVHVSCVQACPLLQRASLHAAFP